MPGPENDYIMVQRYCECLSDGPMVRAEIGAVVAAAGLSSRMQAFKPMLPLGDSTIIRTLIAGLRAAGVSAITVVTGHNADRLQEHLSGLDIAFADNKDYATTDMLCSAGIGLSFMHKARSYEVITQGMYNAGMVLFIMILLSLVWRIYHVGTKAKN